MIKDEIVVMTVGEYNQMQGVVKGQKHTKKHGYVAMKKGVSIYSKYESVAREKCYNTRVKALI